ncbi:hypothetical protein A11A3_12243 [Alcanivorax hongdengensis A-11-3]|uniref:Uncharacterized protein n=1 Tax=Alcanivorax hongdengensis A-11-3 TaxID=1177179 RepID=L0WAD0_9GAMM|nr:hypothetical protein [Alcanivorax hongdengensis]EKF73733.1 hypothetical protein A11A3_12243 [Alcanivorax hongdengensis A-11-3]
MPAWIEKIKRWLGAAPPATADNRDEEDTPAPAANEYHPAHGSDQDPQPLHRGRRRLKETFTSHWDLDYLPRDELEQVLEDEKNDRQKDR